MKSIHYVFLVWICVVGIAQADEFDVRYEQGIYYLTAKFDVEASPVRVMAVLTDYENIANLSPAIKVSEIIATPDDTKTRIRTVVHDCVLFFCKDITRVEDMLQDGNNKLEAIVIPLLSDLRSGYASWELTQNPSSTTVEYHAKVQPKFWVPPIIRSYVLTRKFKARVIESVEQVRASSKTNHE